MLTGGVSSGSAEHMQHMALLQVPDREALFPAAAETGGNRF